MKKIIIPLLIFGCATACKNSGDDLKINQPPPCDEPVNIETGALIGVGDTIKACAYLGIPFAAPTDGANRFRPPQPAEPWEAPRRADTPGSVCPQSYIEGFAEVPTIWVGAEDCLNLNVWRPRENNLSPLPVMVFIHGGAFTVGAGSWSVYNGADLADQGIVVVSINYRLGPFGYLALPELRDEASDGSYGNYGTLDQIEALKWVKNNIGAFGGDPENVTIFGESAGAMSVCTLMAAKPARGLFQRAIIESGGCTAVADETEGFSKGATFAVDMGCDQTGPELIECLRSFEPREFFEIAGVAILGKGGYYPHIDGVVLEDSPLELIKSGAAAGITLIAGSNKDEVMPLGILPENLVDKNLEWSAFYSKLSDLYGADELDALKNLYPETEYANPAELWLTMQSDFVLTCPTRIAAKYQRDFGSTYHYIFSFDDFGISEQMGAFHAWELGFVFGIETSFNYWLLSSEEYDQSKRLSDTVQRYWANFARTGDPNNDRDPAWPLFTTDETMYLDLPQKTVTAAVAERCDYWESRIPMGLDAQTENFLPSFE